MGCDTQVAGMHIVRGNVQGTFGRGELSRDITGMSGSSCSSCSWFVPQTDLMLLPWWAEL